jgi:hypothetical protein
MKNIFIIVLVLIPALFALNGFKGNEVTVSKTTKITGPVQKVSEVITGKRHSASFRDVKLFETDKQNADRRKKSAAGFVKEASFLKLNTSLLRNVLGAKEENIKLSIPLSESKSIKLELTRSDILSNDFTLRVKNSASETVVPYSDGIHYNGIIEGDEKSIAAISIFDNFVMGLLSDASGNYVLGSVKDGAGSYTDNYIFYKESDLRVTNNFECKVDDFDTRADRYWENFGSNVKMETFNDNAVNPVKVFFVCDYDMYQVAGGNLQLIANFVNGIFNQVKTMYQNEQIPFEIAAITVYNQPDPMAMSDDSYKIRQIFAAQVQNNMQGSHIAHLLSTRDIGAGGIAQIRSLCLPYNPVDSSGSYAYSNIGTSYEPYPTYSFTTLVVTHEMGHNIGSRHTHACVWPLPGGIRSIDTCTVNGENEPCYAPGTQPAPAKGTIMSYCHFWQNEPPYGTNLALGFGPLPGDTIRLRYSQAPCLSVGISPIGTEVPSEYMLEQNYPNPFNPSTNITFSIASNALVKLVIYDAQGKELVTLLNENITAGKYNYSFNAAGYPSGVYFYRLTALTGEKEFREVKKMLLVK